MTFDEAYNILTQILTEETVLLNIYDDPEEIETRINALEIARECIKVCERMTGGDL